MCNDKRTLMDSIHQLSVYHHNNPHCFTRSDQNDLEGIKRNLARLNHESRNGSMNNPSHHQAFDRIRTTLKRLEQKCTIYQQEQRWQEELCVQVKYNENHKPAGSPDGTGGQFDFGSGGGHGSPGREGSGNGSGRGGAVVPPRRSEPSFAGRLWQETFGSRPARADELPRATIRGRNVSLPPQASNAYAVIRHAADNVVNPAEHPHGNKKCGIKVRESIEAGGIKIPKELRQNSAKDFGKMLTNPEVGFHPEVGADRGNGYPPSGYRPKPGDVIVIQPSSSSVHGHTAIYAGKETYAERGKQNTREIWISDYAQESGPYPNQTYRNEKPSYVIYRHPILTN